ncbi:MAG TPA: arsenate reductase (thioredoxin) [Firmicutes bacterium]|nr:arsenate reductase (thioredoxin) [Bacillota bacterium]
MAKLKIVFICTGNSCRSQMAEGFARHLGGDGWEVHSSGLEPKGVHPLAIEVMREVGVDISGQSSKGIDEGLLRCADLVVTLCGDAEESCPLTPPGVRRLHWALPDPARAQGTEAEVRAVFRQVRDRIRQLVADLWQEVGK